MRMFLNEAEQQNHPGEGPLNKLHVGWARSEKRAALCCVKEQSLALGCPLDPASLEGPETCEQQSERCGNLHGYA
jgi:hypothetical protein